LSNRRQLYQSIPASGTPTDSQQSMPSSHISCIITCAHLLATGCLVNSIPERIWSKQVNIIDGILKTPVFAAPKGREACKSREHRTMLSHNHGNSHAIQSLSLAEKHSAVISKTCDVQHIVICDLDGYTSYKAYEIKYQLDHFFVSTANAKDTNPSVHSWRETILQTHKSLEPFYRIWGEGCLLRSDSASVVQ
jgi:hypothetical protein